MLIYYSGTPSCRARSADERDRLRTARPGGERCRKQGWGPDGFAAAAARPPWDRSARPTGCAFGCGLRAALRRARPLTGFPLWPLAGLLAVAAVACAVANSPPRWIDVPTDPKALQAVVGVQYTLELRAEDREGDSLGFSFRAPDVTEPSRLKLTKTGSGTAFFKWSPLAEDVGDHRIDFVVSDGRSQAVETLTISVRSDSGEAGKPVFIEPQGKGMALDLSQSRCIEDLRILVEDTDSTDVAIGQVAPEIEGSQLQQDSPPPFQAHFYWCPSDAQIEAADTYRLVLSADDYEHEPTIKQFVITLFNRPGSECVGQSPSIEHTPPGAQRTLSNIDIQFRVRDDVGLKKPPDIYYSLDPPESPPSDMIRVGSERRSGDALDGVYGGSIPSPVASDPPGTSRDLYYVLVAQDSDTADGKCVHTTTLPASESFELEVTRPQESPGLGFCEACTSDDQCGGADDNCVRLGAAAASFCLRDCESNPSPCPGDASCSASALRSVDGKSRKQCLPRSESCTAAPACEDDYLEDNDSMASIPNPTSADLAEGMYLGLMLCPSATNPEAEDEDYYALKLAAPSLLDVLLEFAGDIDLDLQILDGNGVVVGRSYEIVGTSEEVSLCLQPGTYYIHPFTFWSPIEAPYDLTLLRTPQTACCSNDSGEPDGEASEAHDMTSALASGGSFTASNRQICSGDQDWYEVALRRGDKIVVDLTFDQQSSGEDLDLYFYDRDGTSSLTPCPPCDANNGQSNRAPEHMEMVAPADGTYYVVVKGRAAAENGYTLTAKVLAVV